MDAAGVTKKQARTPKTFQAIKSWIEKNVEADTSGIDWKAIKITPEVEFQINDKGVLVLKK